MVKGENGRAKEDFACYILHTSTDTRGDVCTTDALTL
jgi:hypothetical protein